MHDTVTGIPVDLLFLALAALVSAIGGVMWHEIRSLRNESSQRGVHITALRVLVKQVCDKLNISYSDGD